MFRQSIPTLAALALMAGAGAVIAQTAPTPTPSQDPPGQAAMLRAKGEAYSRAPDSEQNPAEVSETARLNAEIAAQNDAASLMEQRAVEASVDTEMAASAESEKANQRYLADKAAYDAAQAEYEEARATWEGLIRACVESGRRDCEPARPAMAPPPPPPVG